MTKSQRENKRRKATLHKITQRERARIALADAEAALRRAKKGTSDAKIADAMEKRGYERNPKTGNWRAIPGATH